MEKQKKEINYRIKKLNLTHDGNNGIVLAVMKNSNDTFTAFVYTVQKTPNAAVLMYRWNIGNHPDHKTALREASIELADRFRYLITLILEEKTDD